MPTLVGFGTFAALPEERISEKISRRVLSGDQGMIVWWSIGAGVHVEPHSHANEQIVWMLEGQDGVSPRERTAGLRPWRRRGRPRRRRARGMVPGRRRGDRFLRAPAGGLPTRRQTRLHERRLNSSRSAKAGPSNLRQHDDRCERFYFRVKCCAFNNSASRQAAAGAHITLSVAANWRRNVVPGRYAAVTNSASDRRQDRPIPDRNAARKRDRSSISRKPITGSHGSLVPTLMRTARRLITYGWSGRSCSGYNWVNVCY